jgi:hypothetical protein
MKHIKVQYLLAEQDEPTCSYHEGDGTEELRRIELYAGGSKKKYTHKDLYALEVIEVPDFPSEQELLELAKDPEFAIEHISQDEFDAVWNATEPAMLG